MTDAFNEHVDLLSDPLTRHAAHEVDRLTRGRALTDEEIGCYLADRQTPLRHGTAPVGDEIADDLRERLAAGGPPWTGWSLAARSATPSSKEAGAVCPHCEEPITTIECDACGEWFAIADKRDHATGAAQPWWSPIEKKATPRVCNCSPGDGWLHAKTCPKHIGWATPDNAGRSSIEKEAASADAGGSLSFAEFSSTNRARCEAPDGFGHPLSGWTISDWMLAATGEFGEAANVAKKLNRERDGIPGNTKSEAELRADLADEFADAVIYLDLAAQSQGIDLGAAVASKFNRTSAKIGAPHRLSESTGSEGGGS